MTLFSSTILVFTQPFVDLILDLSSQCFTFGSKATSPSLNMRSTTEAEETDCSELVYYAGTCAEASPECLQKIALAPQCGSLIRALAKHAPHLMKPLLRAGVEISEIAARESSKNATHELETKEQKAIANARRKKKKQKQERQRIEAFGKMQVSPLVDRCPKRLKTGRQDNVDKKSANDDLGQDDARPPPSCKSVAEIARLKEATRSPGPANASLDVSEPSTPSAPTPATAVPAITEPATPNPAITESATVEPASIEPAITEQDSTLLVAPVVEHDPPPAYTEVAAPISEFVRTIPSLCPEVTLGLLRGNQEILEHFRKHFRTSVAYRKKRAKEYEDFLNAVFEKVHRLACQLRGRKLKEHLDDQPGVLTGPKQLPETSTTDSIAELVDKIDVMIATGIKDKTLKAQFQMQLAKKTDEEVERQLSTGCITAGDHPFALYLNVLGSLAKQRANGSKTAQKELKTKYAHMYQAGRKWIQVCEWFGGSGTVLVWITAGTRPPSPPFPCL